MEAKTEAEAAALARKNGLALKDMPEGMRSFGLCLAAVKQNGMALKDVPEDVKTAALCLEAVRHEPAASKWAPDFTQERDGEEEAQGFSLAP